MFQSKSFNLVTEDDIKKSKKSKKYGWLRCLLIPAIIGFILTLLLVNVDFLGDHTKEATTTDSLHPTYVTDDATPTVSTDNTSEMYLFNLIEGEGKLWKNLTKTQNTLKRFTELSQRSPMHDRDRIGDICMEKANPCTLSCSGTLDEKILSKRLEDQMKKCPYDMELTLQGSIIRTLGRNFLNGNFRLKKLNFFNCILDAITDNAFKKPSLKNLQNLIISDSTITKMNSFTFEGLESLQHFEMINKETLSSFDAKRFLLPMAGTLARLIFKQESFLEPYDPTPWLDVDGKNFIQLTDVDLSDNYFRDTLNENTFSKLVSVRNLNLRNCRMTHFKENTFQKVKETLQKLDLSHNLFKALNPDFLFCMSGSNVIILLSSNSWDCSCHNEEFVENIKTTKIQYELEPKCSTPPHLTGIEIRNVHCCEPGDKCELQPTTISSTLPEISPKPPTVEVKTTTEITRTPPSTITTTLTTKDNPESIDRIELVCKTNFNESNSTISVENHYVAYTIRDASPTSTTIELEFLMVSDGLHLFYFESGNRQIIKTIEITERITPIKDLIARKDYLYCATRAPQEQAFSPFNCRGHHTAINFNPKAWLKDAHMPIFFSIMSFVVVVFLLMGAGIVFLILRWRPTLLKGSKRLFRFDAGCKQVFLSKENSDLSTEELYEALRTYVSVYNTPMGNLTNSDYLQYIRDMDTSRAIYCGVHFPENLPPVERAPARPPAGLKRPLSEQSTIPANDAISWESINESIEEHEYQSLDFSANANGPFSFLL